MLPKPFQSPHSKFQSKPGRGRLRYRGAFAGACALCLCLGCRGDSDNGASDSFARPDGLKPAPTGPETALTEPSGRDLSAQRAHRASSAELQRSLLPASGAPAPASVPSRVQPPSAVMKKREAPELASTPVSAVGAGAHYRVVGVAQDDTLSLRAQPGVQAHRVGGIPPGAGVVATGPDRRVGVSVWRAVEYAGQRGWVNARYLSEPHRSPSGVLPVALKCYGTEPFWALALTQNGPAACTQSCDGPPGLSAGAARPAGDHRWVVPVTDRSGAAYLSLTLKDSGSCSDGMSDRVFPLSARAVRADGVHYQGCCRAATP